MKENGIVVDASSVFDEVREGETVCVRAGGRMIDIDEFFRQLDAGKRRGHPTGTHRKVRNVLVGMMIRMCEMEWLRQTGQREAFMEMALREEDDWEGLP